MTALSVTDRRGQSGLGPRFHSLIIPRNMKELVKVAEFGQPASACSVHKYVAYTWFCHVTSPVTTVAVIGHPVCTHVGSESEAQDWKRFRFKEEVQQ